MRECPTITNQGQIKTLPYSENFTLKGESYGLKEEKTVGILNSAFELQLLPPARGLQQRREEKGTPVTPGEGSLTHHHSPVCEDDPELKAQPGPSPERDLCRP